AHALQRNLPSPFQVVLGMRYGQPSIKDAIKQLRQRQCQKIIVLPLFPQYSAAATGSALEATLKAIGEQTIIGDLEIISDFYQDSGYIAAQAHLIQSHLQKHTD